jgi:hypothetical protein
MVAGPAAAACPLKGALGGLIQPGDVFTLKDNRTDTTVYGVGTTLAGGVGNTFATVDFQYITSYTEAADAELSMAIATPMVGYSFIDYGFRVMLGRSNRIPRRRSLPR